MIAWVLYLALGLGTVALHAGLARSGVGSAPAALPYLGALVLLYFGTLPLLRRVGSKAPLPAVLWAFLVAATAMALHWGDPVTPGDEVLRYRWDGRVAVAGENPYAVRPNDPDLASLRSALPETLPHPDRPGTHAPLAELTFYALSRFGLDSTRNYRLLVSGLTLLAGVALLALCRPAGIPGTHVALFLWHPLLIVGSGAQARLEGPALLFVLGSATLLVQGHQLTPTGLLGLGTLLTPFPATFLPLYVRRVPWFRLGLFLLVILAGVLPFLGAGRELATTARFLVLEQRANPGGFVLVEKFCGLVGRPGWAIPMLAVLGLGVAGMLAVTDKGTPRSYLNRALILAAFPALLGPVVEPAHVLWFLPFLALLPETSFARPGLFYLSGSLVLATLSRGGADLPPWVPWAEFAPVPLLFAAGWWWSRRA